MEETLLKAFAIQTGFLLNERKVSTNALKCNDKKCDQGDRPLKVSRI